MEKLVHRTDGAEHFLMCKTASGELHQLGNDVQKIVIVETVGMADKLSQLFPGLHLHPGSSFAIVSLD